MLENKKIRDFSGNEYDYNEFIVYISTLDKKGGDFYIGTDSQVLSGKISIVTCVCYHNEVTHKNKIFFVKEKIRMDKYPTLRAKMLLEAYRSIEAAMEVEAYIDGKIHIHLDIGATKKSATSKFKKELEFLVKAQGYDCAIKPYSWAASSIADKMTKR